MEEAADGEEVGGGKAKCGAGLWTKAALEKKRAMKLADEPRA